MIWIRRHGRTSQSNQRYRQQSLWQCPSDQIGSQSDQLSLLSDR